MGEVEETAGKRSLTDEIAPGTELGPYRIDFLLGAGGMGRVYRATDTRLNRAVAVKVAREGFSERFARETRAIAQLNHPHICTLHDVGPDYLVMELLDGSTLAARLARGVLPLEQTLGFGVQIASALAAAHAKGIVHRDLKPGNIMLTQSGLKVLDFGVAKTRTDEALTETHVIVGTPAYMAPEQKEGKDADARVDIYALGLILREMATGARAGEMQGLPAHFVHVVERCLEPDPAERWQAASDIKKELQWVASAPPTVPVASRSPTSRLGWVVAALAIIGAFVVGLSYFERESPASPIPAKFTVSFEKEIADLSFPNPSPTGESLVFTGVGPNGGSALWIRPLDSVDTRQLAGTEGAQGPIWSPDGKWIAFYANGQLKKVSAGGGPPQTIAALPGFQDAVWGSRGDIVYRPVNRAPLYRIRDSGGSPQPLTTLNESLTENSHRRPAFLPDGRRFLFTSRCAERANNALYLGSLDTPEVRRLMPVQSGVSYIPAGDGRPESLVYYRDGALVVQPFDQEDGRPSGDPVPIVNRVGYNAPSIGAQFRVSLDGRVVVFQSTEPAASRLIWFSRSGVQEGVLGEAGSYYDFRIAPSRNRVAFSAPDPQTGNRDVWFIETARGITSRFTTHVANDWYPVWSPDGRQLMFGSDRAGGTRNAPYVKTSLDSGSSESSHAHLQGNPSDWSADGRWIAYTGSLSEDLMAADLLVGPASGTEQPFPFVATRARETNPRFSPDSRWIAYSSDESGRTEVYVRPFSGTRAAPAGRLQVSQRGGDAGVWGPSGREIFYMAPDGAINAVDTRDLGREETLPPPVQLFPTCPEARPQRDSPPFDTRDGERFLVNCLVEPPGRFTVLTNWTLPR
jgi:serine/threonine protein kinase